MNQSRQNKVQAAITNIREFYAVGKKLPTLTSHRATYGKGIIDGEAERIGMNEDTVRKARHFADPERGYTREELNNLCRLIATQKDQDEDCAVFSKTHIIRLLSIRPRAIRTKLQRQAIKEGWSIDDLDAQISKRFGTRGDGGKRRKIPSSAVDLLAQLENMCESWRRWHTQVFGEEVKGVSEHPALDDLPEELVALLTATGKKLHLLQQRVISELAKKQPGREVRGALRPEGKEKQSRSRAKAK